ncbi:NO-inducible flavohemoprotein [Paenibacillus lemnae]|uniref:Flavohemoprotein n=1 Tax=Paenibacillus lemnae TaxID=1330551 RepID=A0A848M1Y5_PAELE|nr:NO-inducible flavohemoprotein [Paenibacillus lemnae]NMO94576.1 NO-inducible flavohemoprotein [Paenibacillus lemnae]
MLKQQTIHLIKNTIPVLETHGAEITQIFYRRLFQQHPELLNIFNHANQRQGKQQNALANAVYAAAVHIDHLENILPVVKQIAQKHRALQVRPEHYPVVGQTLLDAMKEVLGDAASPEILEAWAEAYGVIADVFINVEKEQYAAAEAAPGGWEGFRRFVIERKVEESCVITSFYLIPEDGLPIASYEPGQYITLRVQPDGQDYKQLRHYSLSAAPGNPYYKISVKREDAASGRPAGTISTWLHDNAVPGTVIEVSAPAGSFVLDGSSDAPLVLISGGVGLTPMVSMLETALNRQPARSVTYIHAAVNGRHHAMKEHIQDLTAKHAQLSSYFIYESPQADEICDQSGYINTDFLQHHTNPNSDFYFCGPQPFMASVYRSLKQLGVTDPRIRYEFFGPAGSLEA